MPGKRPKNPYSGFRSEYATVFALSAYTSVVQIPLQEDYSSDLICTIVEEKGKFLIPSNPFLVQVKCNDSAEDKVVLYDDKDKISWFSKIDIPFYISLVYLKDKPRVDLYRTSEKIPLLYSCQCENISLIKGINTSHNKTWDESGNIWMGKPIISIDLNSMNKKIDDIDKALKFWVSMDQMNLHWRNLGIKFYTRVLHHETNKEPKGNLESKIFYDLQGSTVSQKESASIMLTHEIFHEFLGIDGINPKIAWKNLPPDKQLFFKHAIEVLNRLNVSLAEKVRGIYPELCE